jgi:hypothetical protein
MAQQSSEGGPPPSTVLMQMLFGGLILQAIRAVAKLGIPDLLAERPRTAAEFGKLLQESGFKLTGVVPTNSPMSRMAST